VAIYKAKPFLHLRHFWRRI